MRARPGQGPAAKEAQGRVTKQQPYDPIKRDLDEVWSLYLRLAGRIPPSQGEGGGRRPTPSSRVPISVDIVTHMRALEEYLAWWISGAKWRLEPIQRIELTKREAIRCPTCNGDLIAWLWKETPDRSEIVCTGLDHKWEDGPNRWPPSDWKRLGVHVGSHEDGRFTVGRDSGAA